jgi:hydrogenase expression/formation protein HypC
MCLAVPGRLQAIFETDGVRTGKLNFGGVVKNVCLAYLPDLEIGQYAIVHAGFAISQVDETTAEDTLRMFAEMGIISEELGEEAP